MGGVRVDPGSLYGLGDLDAFNTPLLAPVGTEAQRQQAATAGRWRRLDPIGGEDLEPFLTQPGPEVGAPAQLPAPRRTIQGPALDIRAPESPTYLDELGLTQPDPGAGPVVERRYQRLRNVVAPARAARASAPKAQAPPRGQQALSFAKALGFVGGDDPEVSPEYAEAVSRAFARMTRGMSVARLLSAAKRGSVQDEFQRLVSEEATKLRAAQSNSRGSTPSVSRRSIPI